MKRDEMKHEMTLYGQKGKVCLEQNISIGFNRNVLFQTHLLFVTIYGLWSSFNIRWCWPVGMCHLLRDITFEYPVYLRIWSYLYGCTAGNVWISWAVVHIPNIIMVKNPSLVLLHCTFTMYWPRVYSMSQWWNLSKQKMAAPPGLFIGLQAINALKGTISG